jgi:excinuclease UvrABC helicase subunit UvrB
MATATEPERPIGKSNIQLESDEENSTPDALRDLAVEVRAAMEDAARALDFEEAARLRDRLLAIEERMSISGD